MAQTKILVLDRSEELAEQARAAVEGIWPAVEIVSCTRIGSAEHVQDHDGPFDVMLAGPSLGTRAGLKRLAGLHRDAPATAVIIAFSQRPAGTLRDIVQVGAEDLLELPVDEPTLRGALRRAIDLARRRHSAPEPLPVTAAAGDEATRAPGRVITVSSATGGCGKTFFATNTALFLARNSDRRVALVDLDLQFGEVTTALRLQPPYTIVDALRRDDDEQAEPFNLHAQIEELLIKTEDGFWVLPAPRDPADADQITPLEVTRIIEALRTHFDDVIVDTPTALGETVLAAFDLSEHLIVMATQDLPSVRNLGLFLHTLDKLKVPKENISLVLNKIDRDAGIDVAQIVKLFPQGFRSQLPYAREVSRSINLGKPVLASHPKAEVSRRMRAGLRDLLPKDAQERVIELEPERHARRFGRLFRRERAAAQGGSH